RRPAGAVRWPRARRFVLDRRAQVALRPEGVWRRDEPTRGGVRRCLRARGGVPAAPATRAARGRHHARVLAAVPRAEGVARVPRPRREAVPRRDREEPRRGRVLVSARAGDRGLRGHGGAAAAIDHADPPYARWRGTEPP